MSGTAFETTSTSTRSLAGVTNVPPAEPIDTAVDEDELADELIAAEPPGTPTEAGRSPCVHGHGDVTRRTLDEIVDVSESAVRRHVFDPYRAHRGTQVSHQSSKHVPQHVPHCGPGATPRECI